jgi:hypothetical protein
MDVVSHGLWGGIGFGRKSKSFFWLAFLLGVFPDVLAFSYTFFKYLILGKAITGPITYVPEYVFRLYDFSHSLIAAAFFTVLAFWFWRKRALPILAWPLHILFDIVTHDLAFFPTPFAWPFRTPFFEGIPWSRPWVFFMNWIALGALYLIWFILRRHHNERQ